MPKRKPKTPAAVQISSTPVVFPGLDVNEDERKPLAISSVSKPTTTQTHSKPSKDSAQTDREDNTNTQAQQAQPLTQTENQNQPVIMAQAEGQVTSGVAVLEEPPPASRASWKLVYHRLRLEGRWKDVVQLKDDMLGEARSRGMLKEDAQEWVYSELDRLYPPLPADPTIETGGTGTEGVAPCQPDARVQGLGDVPTDWPTLPPNSSLALEIQWVQANRLLVVDERPSGATHVHLDRALGPAPSHAALGWLETSIRSYAKYVDVAARATASQGDEQAEVRRERLAIEEIDTLLGEMDAETCPHCGEAI